MLGDPTDGVLRVGIEPRARARGRGGKRVVGGERYGLRPDQPSPGYRRVEDGQAELGDGGGEKVGHVRFFEDEHGRLQSRGRAGESEQDGASGIVVQTGVAGLPLGKEQTAWLR